MESRSLVAVRQVMDWASEQGMTIRDLMSAEELEQLRAVFSRSAPWSFALYQPLRAFSHAMARLELPDLPARVNFADALAAIEDVMGGEPWPMSGRRSTEAFIEFGYAQTSAGITRLKERFSAAWREHASKNQEFLLSVDVGRRESALIVGAGKIYDIPLRKLAERFARLILIDIDLDAMQESVERSDLPPSLRENLLLVQADVTGINDVFLERVRKAFEPTSEEEVYAEVVGLLHSYRVATPPELADLQQSEPVDAAFSSMVLSQLATPLTEHLKERCAARFPGSQRWRGREFQVGLGQFAHRVQHTHLRALAKAARVVVVTSDVAETPGLPEVPGVRLPMIGAPHLEELFPAQDSEVVASAEWVWQHLPASKQPPGRHMEVHGVVVRPASTALSAWHRFAPTAHRLG
jgi:hypothetical protein